MKYETIIKVKCGCGEKTMASGVSENDKIDAPKVCNWCGKEYIVIDKEIKEVSDGIN